MSYAHKMLLREETEKTISDSFAYLNSSYASTQSGDQLSDDESLMDEHIVSYAKRMLVQEDPENTLSDDFEYLHDDSSCGSTESDLSDDESLSDEFEERLESFARLANIPAIADMVSDVESFKTNACLSGRRSSLQKTLETDISKKEALLQRSSPTVFYSEFEAVDEIHCLNDMEDTCKSPWEHLVTLMAARDEDCSNLVTPLTDVGAGFFVPMENSNFEAYDGNIAQTVRKGDLERYISLHRFGKPIICCNKFKETTIHTICRRGHEKLLAYALTQKKSCLQVVDDLGRNPLHDACWTDEPNFELVKVIITKCPDLLYISDNRGFTPLEFIGNTGKWREWHAFLDENESILSPRELW